MNEDFSDIRLDNLFFAVDPTLRGNKVIVEYEPALRRVLDDPAPCPRVAAAEVLATFGSAADREQSLAVLLQAADAKKNGVFVAMLALNALQSSPCRRSPSASCLRPCRSGIPTHRPGPENTSAD